MSRQKDRDEFIAIMTEEHVSVAAARQLIRYSTTLTRIAELACSSEAADRDRVPCPGRYDRAARRWIRDEGGCLCRDYGAYEHGIHGEVPRYTVREERVQAAVEELCRQYNLVPDFSGDPRGAVVKLRVPSGRTNDWGQTGICVP